LATGTLTTLNQVALRSSLSQKYDHAADTAAVEARNSLATLALRLGVYAATLSDHQDVVALTQSADLQSRNDFNKSFQYFC
jgi:hypothetical protein